MIKPDHLYRIRKKGKRIACLLLASTILSVAAPVPGAEVGVASDEIRTLPGENVTEEMEQSEERASEENLCEEKPDKPAISEEVTTDEINRDGEEQTVDKRTGEEQSENEDLCDQLEELTAEGAGSTYFTTKEGKFFIKTVNTGTGAVQTQTVKIAVDKKVDMSKDNQKAVYTVTSTGNWKEVTFTAQKPVFGFKLSDGTKSPYFYVIYDRVKLVKPKGYILSSVSIADYLKATSDPYKMGAEIRWDHSNQGGAGVSVTNGDYFDQTLLNQYAPLVGQNDQRFGNTFDADSTLKLLLMTSCRNTGLRLDAQKDEVKNMTITINFAPAEYYVNFNSAGGTACAQAKVKYDADLYLPTPTRKGYTFQGWTGAGLTQAKGTVRNLTTTNQKVLDLTAVWKPNTYTVTYDSNGAGDVSSTAATYDQPFVLPGVEKTGYLFTGWSGSGLESKTGSVSNLTDVNGGKAALTAGWKPIRYTIILRENGGTPCESIDLLYDEETELPTPEREGYTFLGWSGGGLVKKTGTVKNLSESQDSVVELTAEWEKIEIPAETVDPTKSGVIENEFYNTYGMTSEQAKQWLEYLIGGGQVQLKIDGVDFSLVKNTDGSVTIKLADMGNAKKVVIPNEITIGEASYPVTSIAEGCFQNNRKIEEVVFGTHILRIENSAFENCKNLKDVKLNDGLVSIGDRAFFGCSSLKTIALKDGIQSIGNSAFEQSGLTGELRLNEGLLSVGKRAFFGCASLEKLYISKSLLQIGDLAFSDCKKLKSVTHAPGAELLKLGKQVFMSDTALSKVDIPAKLPAISKKAFSGCKTLSKVKGMNAVSRIEDEAFAGCQKLKSITLPARLQRIGKKAFYQCKALKKVSIKSNTLTKVGKQAFVKCSKKIVFKVPKNKSKDYQKLMKGKY